MINRIFLEIDGVNKFGALLQFVEAATVWASRFPLSTGKISIGSYTVPTNTRTLLKGLLVTVQYANVPMVGAFGGWNLASVYFQVDGATKMEYRVQWAGGTLAVAVGGSTFDANWRHLGAILGDMNFTSGQVIRLVVSPVVSAGLVPQILWCSTFTMKDAVTGETIFSTGREVTTTGVAAQVVNTYAVPANGVTLKDISLQALTGDFCLGMIQIRLNGSPILEVPAYATSMKTGPRRGVIPLYNGLTLNHGDVLEFLADPLIALKQKYQVFLWGEETPEGGGGGEYSAGYSG